MEKSDMLKIITIIGALVMIGSIIAPGLVFNPNNGNNNGNSGQILNGIAEFNGTIRTFEPILIVQSQLSQSVIDELKSEESVKSVNPIADGYLINTTTRDDVFLLAESLRLKGIDSWAYASIIMPASITVKLDNGSNVNVDSSGAVRILTLPLVDIDSEVPIRMSATIQDGVLLRYSSPVMLTQNVQIIGNASVGSFIGSESTFMVPWENRTLIDSAKLEQEYGNTTFKRNDFVTFPVKLTIAEMAGKNTLPYVTYISDTSVSVLANFTDKNLLRDDFGNVSIVFPDSELRVLSDKNISLPYNNTVKYIHLVTINGSVAGYDINSQNIQLTLDKKYNEGEQVQLSINAVAIGNKVVKIGSVIQAS